ncbi:MAG: peptidase [Gammaproteobacteria bacterium]|nr:peptidase [Gammaproteobacteria bacterium]OUU07768.1 MAG: hypothetical protein CBB94_12435 [Gammaproteobacteria bacterium TMED34]
MDLFQHQSLCQRRSNQAIPTCLRRGLSIVLVSLVTACGGGGRGNTIDNLDEVVSQDDGFQIGVFQDADNFQNLCQNPRTGNNPATGFPFLDRQGTSTDENNWLRSWSNDLYLWYNEIQDLNPKDYETLEYFQLMRSFELTPSGNFKDQFHFTIDSEIWRQQTQSGVTGGYGITFSLVSSSPPRRIMVGLIEPGSQADQLGIRRGDEVIGIDGLDVMNASGGTVVDNLNAALAPPEGAIHDFVFQRPDGSELEVTMTSTLVALTPVQNVQVIDTNSGPVGYVAFHRHNAPSEALLIDAITSLRGESVTDLVLDIRYNTGGFLDIANQTAAMIAGARAEGQIFDTMRFNDKHTDINPITGLPLRPTPFYFSAAGFSATAGSPLPRMDLDRVYVLTGARTCSASEAIINGLSGIGVEVIIIGETTCGKPYGFYAFDNCGTSYFSIQFRGENAMGFGDYPDGFSPANTPQTEGVPLPGCLVSDDFTRELGDITEARLAAALQYRATTTCPMVSTTRHARQQRRIPRRNEDQIVLEPFWMNSRIEIAY